MAPKLHVLKYWVYNDKLLKTIRDNVSQLKKIEIRLGGGIFAATIGTILQERGFNVK